MIISPDVCTKCRSGIKYNCAESILYLFKFSPIKLFHAGENPSFGVRQCGVQLFFELCLNLAGFSLNLNECISLPVLTNDCGRMWTAPSTSQSASQTNMLNMYTYIDRSTRCHRCSLKFMICKDGLRFAIGSYSVHYADGSKFFPLTKRTMNHRRILTSTTLTLQKEIR